MKDGVGVIGEYGINSIIVGTEGFVWWGVYGGVCMVGCVWRGVYGGVCIVGCVWRGVYGGVCMDGYVWRGVYGGMCMEGCVWRGFRYIDIYKTYFKQDPCKYMLLQVTYIYV